MGIPFIDRKDRSTVKSSAVRRRKKRARKNGKTPEIFFERGAGENRVSLDGRRVATLARESGGGRIQVGRGKRSLPQIKIRRRKFWLLRGGKGNSGGM